MKPTQAFVLAATSAIFLLTFFIASGIPTGLLVNDRLEVDITVAKAYDDSALITWSTSRDAISTIVVDGKSAAFQASSVFSREITGLKPGTTYNFIIRACDENGCTEKAGSFTTKSQPAEGAAITGALTGGEGATQLIKTSVNLILYSLLAITITIIVGKVGYEQLANRDPMKGLVKKANRHMEENNYSEAYQAYNEAREAFKQLAEDAKVKHYDALLNTYNTLKRYATIKEAQQLAEKYENGTITSEELRRLNELLAN